MENFTKNLTIALILLTISSCQSYKNRQLQKQQHKEKISQMNQALDLCNKTRLQNTNPTKQFYDQYYQFKTNAGDVWAQYQNYDDLFYRNIQGNFKISYKQAITDCDNAIATSFEIYKIETEMENENKFAKELGYKKGIFGYQDKNYNSGIVNFFNYIYNQNKENSLTPLNQIIDNNKEFLIKATLLDRNFLASVIIDNLVIYQLTNQNNKIMQFALVKDAGESYLENFSLIGKYFAISKTAEIKIDNKTIEVFVLKKVS